MSTSRRALPSVVRSLRLVSASCFAASLAACSGAAMLHVEPVPVAVVAAPDATGRWETDSEAIGGRGGGHIAMDAVQRQGGVSFTYPGGTMVCSLRGDVCEGTWQGSTGSGWFAVTLAPDGRAFDGTWGYGEDRARVAAFTGRR